jgi:hypothetical protein
MKLIVGVESIDIGMSIVNGSRSQASAVLYLEDDSYQISIISRLISVNICLFLLRSLSNPHGTEKQGATLPIVN